MRTHLYILSEQQRLTGGWAEGKVGRRGAEVCYMGRYTLAYMLSDSIGAVLEGGGGGKEERGL